MNEFYEKAIERLHDDKGLSGNKERAMAPAVREALEKFCEEDGEFAQAVAQSGSFPECMQAVVAANEVLLTDEAGKVVRYDLDSETFIAQSLENADALWRALTSTRWVAWDD